MAGELCKVAPLVALHGEEDEHGAAGRDMMSDIVSQPYLVCTVR